MATVEAHYRDHLAPVYAWMAGGMEAAWAAGSAELDELRLEPRPGDLALDLGAGFGMHAVPLARRGVNVLALDSSAQLLDALQRNAVGLPLQAVRDDLLSFPRHLRQSPRFILCMGDTITHLPDMASLERLAGMAAKAIARGGLFVITFRDYSQALVGDRRFVHVRSDKDRILTCFLEYEAQVVKVHDVLHQRRGDAWEMTVSSYPKLRVQPEQLIDQLRSVGFSVVRQAGLRGMVRLVCSYRRTPRNKKAPQHEG